MKELVRNTIINFADFRLINPLRRFLNEQSQKINTDIGLPRLGKNAPRVLIIYVATSIPYFKAGNVFGCPILDSHAMYWEAAEMVKILNEQGFVVDFLDCFKPLPKIDWSKYSIVIDEGNNLIHAPKVKDQVRVFYCTGLHWAFHNQAELMRIENFYLRNGLLIEPQRWLRPNYSDRVADHIFYWANKDWMKLFYSHPQRHEITTSVTYIPDKPSFQDKGRDFVWIGSSGAIHKGLDLAVEAVREIPEARLRIFGHIQSDALFFSWLNEQMRRHSNISFHGSADFKEPNFHQMMEKCAGHIYPSCSEGGPGSVAQTSHFGLIPIVTNTANVRSGSLGYEIEEENPAIIIKKIKESVTNVLEMNSTEISKKKEQVIEFARTAHTRAAYSSYFSTFVKSLIKP